MLNSGVNATIQGVQLAFAVPFGNEKLPSYFLQHWLHKPVAFTILPLFALANTAIVLQLNWHNFLRTNYYLGIALGLIIGKAIGIWLFSFISVKLKLCQLANDLNWKSILGVSILGGIGFTMSIFITLLAFSNEEHINNAKIMILISTFITAAVGLLYLKMSLKTKLS